MLSARRHPVSADHHAPTVACAQSGRGSARRPPGGSGVPVHPRPSRRPRHRRCDRRRRTQAGRPPGGEHRAAARRGQHAHRRLLGDGQRGAAALPHLGGRPRADRVRLRGRHLPGRQRAAAGGRRLRRGPARAPEVGGGGRVRRLGGEPAGHAPRTRTRRDHRRDHRRPAGQGAADRATGRAHRRRHRAGDARPGLRGTPEPGHAGCGDRAAGCFRGAGGCPQRVPLGLGCVFRGRGGRRGCVGTRGTGPAVGCRARAPDGPGTVAYHGRRSDARAAAGLRAARPVHHRGRLPLPVAAVPGRVRRVVVPAVVCGYQHRLPVPRAAAGPARRPDRPGAGLPDRACAAARRVPGRRPAHRRYGLDPGHFGAPGLLLRRHRRGTGRSGQPADPGRQPGQRTGSRTDRPGGGPVRRLGQLRSPVDSRRAAACAADRRRAAHPRHPGRRPAATAPLLRCCRVSFRAFVRGAFRAFVRGAFRAFVRLGVRGRLRFGIGVGFFGG